MPALRFGCWGGQGVKLAKRRSSQTQPLARTRGDGNHLDFSKTRKTKRKREHPISAIGERKSARKKLKQTCDNKEQPLARDANGKSFKKFDPGVSEDAHFCQHRNCKGFCIRCDLHRDRKSYEAVAMFEGKQQSWLTIGAHRGVWGMGCSVCAKVAAAGAHIGSRWSKFARFQVRPPSRYRAREALVQHAASLSHRRACGMLRRVQPLARKPTGQPIVVRQTQPRPPQTSNSIGDANIKRCEVFRGNVPSAVEWQDAWAVLSDQGGTLRGQARIEDKRNSETCQHGSVNRRRKRLRNQLQIMAEVIRRNIRRILSEATNITLAIDEAQHYKIVRFRAALAEPQPLARDCFYGRISASNHCVSGVLGILDCSKKHAKDFEDDHAVTAAYQLDDFLTRFCSPLGPADGHRAPQPLACDATLKAEIIKKVTCFAADGAAKERRALSVAARDLFPNNVILIRDPAHAIRIATKSLHCDELFGKVWHELFDGRNALAPDIMNSKKWESLLVAIQQDNAAHVQMPGDQNPMARVIRNLDFAKQRFDSTAGPVAKIALMFLPVATLLSYIASDKRHDSEQRDRATSLLKLLDSKFCIATGVSADWGIICAWFLRLFDNANHDIAKSRSEIDCMIETLDAVFLEGRVFKVVKKQLQCRQPLAQAIKL